ncbi:MAG TPA: type II toxin-antitoxin system RelE/ParE family toxin [Xanthobacteraceae bacterium]|nr:type II toxin-antitoxin system RelE/ParE family toxin [Xanthobacteraceae bacterium]
MITDPAAAKRPVEFVSSSLRELRSLPKPVRSVFGYAILLAQKGEKHLDAKPLNGFGGAGVLEVVEDFDGSTYRAVYTVKFAGVVYVLYAFQKKSKRGRATPRQDIDRIRERLKIAQTHYEENYQGKKQIERPGRDKS